MAGTSHVKLGFLSQKLIFAEFGLYHEEKGSVASTSFKKINQLRHATRKGEGGRFPLSFFKIDQSTIILENIALFVCRYGLNSHFRYSFKNILEKI